MLKTILLVGKGDIRRSIVDTDFTRSSKLGEYEETQIEAY